MEYSDNSKERETLKEMVLKRLKEVDFPIERESLCIEHLEKKIFDILLVEGEIKPRAFATELAIELSNEILGLGPIQEFLTRPDVTEIMINGPHEVFIEIEGRIERLDVSLRSNEKVIQLIRKVIGPLNMRLDETNPMVDARLPDGSRLNAVIPPLCLNGPAVTIRKFARKPFSLKNLVEIGSIPAEVADFLKRAVHMKANILISGGASSGKTTLLNALCSLIPENERLITIEDAAELRIEHPHVVSLESRTPNIEGKGEVTVRDLVRNALRMRPDRIIVGEVRGAEALDMLQAMNTGHPGSISTAHANSSQDLLFRLETMVMMSDLNLSLDAIRRQISSAIDLICHMERNRDGGRFLKEISSVWCDQNGRIDIEPVFTGKNAEPPFTGGKDTVSIFQRKVRVL